MRALLLGLAFSGPTTLASEADEYSTYMSVEELLEYNATALNTTEKGENLGGGNSSQYNITTQYHTTTLATIVEEEPTAEGNLTEYNATTTSLTKQPNMNGGSGSAYLTTDEIEVDEYTTTPHTTPEQEATSVGQVSGNDATISDTTAGGGTAGDVGTHAPLRKVWYISDVGHGEESFIVVEGAMVHEAVQSLPSDSLCKYACCLLILNRSCFSFINDYLLNQSIRFI